MLASTPVIPAYQQNSKDVQGSTDTCNHTGRALLVACSEPH